MDLVEVVQSFLLPSCFQTETAHTRQYVWVLWVFLGKFGDCEICISVVLLSLMDTDDFEGDHYNLRVDCILRREYSKNFMSLPCNDFLELLSRLPTKILTRIYPLHTQ